MAERPADAQRCDQLTTPGIDDDDRQDRECGPEKHHLAYRIAVADPAHEHRHDRKKQGRGDLEQDGLEEIHRPARLTAASWKERQLTTARALAKAFFARYDQADAARARG